VFAVIILLIAGIVFYIFKMRKDMMANRPSEDKDSIIGADP
jgi:hypothetical protein